MKKILPVFAFAALLSMSLKAQVTITRNDMPDTGDTIRTSFTAAIGAINYEQAGANISWDFSDLLPGLQTVDTFVSINTLPFTYQIVFNPLVASIASPVSGFDLVPGVDLTDVYQFFRETNDFFGNAGVAFTFSGIPLPLKYDNPDVYFNFPVTYLSADSSESSFNLSLPDIGYLETTRKRVNHVDAWGTVTTPYGEFQAIRVKSFLTTYDSIYIDSISFGQGLNRSFIEYKWLANNMGIPVMQIDEEGPLLTARYIDSVRLITSVENLVFQVNVARIFPNPTHDYFYAELSLVHSGMTSIEVYDLAGRLQGKPYQEFLNAGKNIRKISVNHLPPGVYFVRTSNPTQTSIRKLLVN
ncbi:MAG: T9SS type A sorting domain-containing protein [Bacteroidales bacterium]|nr:T9SS type A sorting domain-containing protein [Bacteroidales bacterium]